MAWIAGRSSATAGRTCTSSVRIIRLLAIEDALQRAEVRGRILGCVGAHHAAGLAHHLFSYRLEGAPGGAREHLEAASALQVVKQIERLGHRRSRHDDAMVG